MFIEIAVSGRIYPCEITVGVSHTSDPKSIMFDKSTPSNDYIFKKVFEEFETEQLLLSDRVDLMDIFLESQHKIDWMDKSSPLSIKWSNFMVSQHPECEGWTAQKVTTVTEKPKLGKPMASVQKNVNFIFSKFPNLQNCGHRSDFRRSITLDFQSQKDIIRVALKSVSKLRLTIREIFIRK